jgi:undecaprenyl-diphosphatase
MSSRRRHDLAGLIVGSVGLLATAAIAKRGLAEGEREVFRAANELPGSAYRAVWVGMQYGTFATAPALSGLAWLTGRRTFAAELLVSGSAAWVLAKVVKRFVGRERPHRILSAVRLRGTEEGDLGFPSGHAAVSAALSTAAMPSLPPLARAGAVGLAGFVSFSRVYVGAHLPLDVVGGAALGVALGSAAHLAFGRDRVVGRAQGPG